MIADTRDTDTQSFTHSDSGTHCSSTHSTSLYISPPHMVGWPITIQDITGYYRLHN